MMTEFPWTTVVVVFGLLWLVAVRILVGDIVADEWRAWRAETRVDRCDECHRHLLERDLLHAGDQTICHDCYERWW